MAKKKNNLVKKKKKKEGGQKKKKPLFHEGLLYTLMLMVFGPFIIRNYRLPMVNEKGRKTYREVDIVVVLNGKPVLGIEVDGPFHFRPRNKSKSAYRAFMQQKKRDRETDRLCLANGFPLYRIPCVFRKVRVGPNNKPIGAELLVSEPVLFEEMAHKMMHAMVKNVMKGQAGMALRRHLLLNYNPNWRNSSDAWPASKKVPEPFLSDPKAWLEKPTTFSQRSQRKRGSI